MINKINVDGVDHEIVSESAEKKIADMVGAINDLDNDIQSLQD